MITIGLTGSIASGKSTTVAMFAAAGVPVQDADAVVHGLYAHELAPQLQALVPSAAITHGIDRTALRAWVQAAPENLAALEAIVHPAVQAKRQQFIADCAAKGHRMCVLDVPLLFEVGVNTQVHVVVLTHAAPDVIAQRLAARPNFDAALHAKLQTRQISFDEKRKQAHFLVDTGQGMAYAQTAVHNIIRCLHYII